MQYNLAKLAAAAVLETGLGTAASAQDIRSVTSPQPSFGAQVVVRTVSTA